MSTHRFFEEYFSYSPEKNEVDEYFFTSTRKGWNHYGIIIRIFRNKEILKSDFEKIVFKDKAVTVVRTNYTRQNVNVFIDQIKTLPSATIILNSTDEISGWNNDGWGSFDYTAIELKFYLEQTGGRIGDQYSPRLYEAIKKQFFTSRLKYFSEEFFSVFCALESIPMEIELAILCLIWLTPQPDIHETEIIDFQSFGKGIDANLLFKSFPIKTVIKDHNLTLHKPAYSDKIIRMTNTYDDFESSQIISWSKIANLRFVKIDQFKNSPLSYWFLHKIEDEKNEDTLEHVIKKYEASGINLFD